MMVLGITFYVTGRLWSEGVIPPVKISPWKNVWPLGAGLGLYAAVSWAWRKIKGPPVAIPPGDVYHVLVRVMVLIVKPGRRILAGLPADVHLIHRRAWDPLMGLA